MVQRGGGDRTFAVLNLTHLVGPNGACLMIEFEKEPGSIVTFSEVLDKTLKELNSDYEAKRHKNIALGPPLVKSVPKGLFINWLRKKGKLGGQHKVPRLSNDRQHIDELLEMLRQV